MKKRLSLLLVLVLAVFVIASVGYAAWYITRDPQSDTANVQAYAVDSSEIEVHTCDASGTNGDQSIIFGRPVGSVDGDNAGNWLQFDVSDAEQNLTVYIKVTATAAGTFTLSATNDDNASTLYSAPTFAVHNAGTTGATITSNTTLNINAAGDAIISVTYTWALGNNPFVYFNNEQKNDALTSEEYAAANLILTTDVATDGTAKWKDYAKNYLTDVFALNNTTFTITVTDVNA